MGAYAEPRSGRQLVGYNNFKRSNPETDRFKVRSLCCARHLQAPPNQ